MDYEKYYLRKKDGSYSIHFPNDKALSIEEIEQLFSEYGKVLSVNGRDDKHGLRFVRFRSLEETIKCIQGLQHSSTIRILRQKFKGAEDRVKEGSNTQRQWGKGEKVGNHTNQSNEDALDSTKFRKKQTYNENTTNQDAVSDCSTTSRDSQRYNKTMNDRQKSDVQVTKEENILKLIQHRNTNRRWTTTCDKEEIPALISTDDIKSHSSRSTDTKTSLSKLIIPAQEVIVANVHPNFGTPYILHLFEKYEPISASLVKTTPIIELRYCHVYFKSTQSALQVEEEFDNYPLCGKNLIVLRSQKLTERAAFL